MAAHTPNDADRANADARAGIPGSSVPAHPTDAIPLPAHGFDTLDAPVRELASVPAADVISRAAVLLISASAEKLGLVTGAEPDLDLAEAARLINALAGLLAAALDDLGAEQDALREGLRTLQNAYREASAQPVAPGAGPGETLLS